MSTISRNLFDEAQRALPLGLVVSVLGLECLDCSHAWETTFPMRTPVREFGRLMSGTICPACGAPWDRIGIGHAANLRHLLEGHAA